MITLLKSSLINQCISINTKTKFLNISNKTQVIILKQSPQVYKLFIKICGFNHECCVYTLFSKKNKEVF